MKIFIGADHAGFKLKEVVKSYLERLGFGYEDLGNKKLQPHDDYPVFAFRVAKAVAKSKSFGILFCGSSHGMAIAANKVRGIRAVAVNNTADARLTRQHNDANVLCLSGWELSKSMAEKILKVWLSTKFSGVARHKRRIAMIRRFES